MGVEKYQIRLQRHGECVCHKVGVLYLSEEESADARAREFIDALTKNGMVIFTENSQMVGISESTIDRIDVVKLSGSADKEAKSLMRKAYGQQGRKVRDQQDYLTQWE